MPTGNQSAPSTADPRGAALTEEPSLLDGRLAVSIVVPVYNDPEGIRSTLDSLVNQTVPRTAYEVVVVDNGSTDGTRDVVAQFVDRFENVRLEVESEIQGSYAARNRGIQTARGSVLAFVDADMTADPDWLRRAVTAMEATDAPYLACDVELYPPENEEGLVGKYNRLTDLRVDRYLRRMRFAPTCSLLVRMSLLKEVGPFDPRFRSSGDLEFGHRVDNAGRTMYYAPEVQLYHPARTTLRALLGKSFRIGRGKVELHRFYPDRYGHPIRRLLSPGGYLPPSPSYVSSTTREWDSLTVHEKVGFYLIAYAARLSKSAGQLWEAGAQARRSAGAWFGRSARTVTRP